MKEKSRFLTITGYVMTVLFLLSTAVQYNDPDAILWIGIYGTATLTTWLFIKDKLYWSVSAAIALAVLAGAGVLGYEVVSSGVSGQLLGESWQMQNLTQEKVREAGGLLIVGIWSLIMAFAIRKGRVG